MHGMVALEYSEENVRISKDRHLQHFVFPSVDRLPADRFIREERRLRERIDEFVHLLLPLLDVHSGASLRSGKGEDPNHFVIAQPATDEGFGGLPYFRGQFFHAVAKVPLHTNLVNSNGTKPILH
jgi:hypothetical protein